MAQLMMTLAMLSFSLATRYADFAPAGAAGPGVNVAQRNPKKASTATTTTTKPTM
jgi:hypothetical protein